MNIKNVCRYLAASPSAERPSSVSTSVLSGATGRRGDAPTLEACAFTFWALSRAIAAASENARTAIAVEVSVKGC